MNAPLCISQPEGQIISSPPPDFQIFLRPCTACVWVCSSKFANRDDGQDGSLHDFVIEFDMFHMHVELIILSTLLYTKSLYISRSVRYLPSAIYSESIKPLCVLQVAYF